MPAAPEELRRRIDDEIRRALQGLEDAYGAHSAEGIVGQLREAIFPGGKRIRPLLCCLGHMASGGAASEAIIKAAASLELLHTFAILHDDIMDAPMARRRRPPAHARVADMHTALEGAEGASRLGLSIAMLAGDLALVASDDLFMTSGFEPDRLASAWKPLSQMRLDAIAGQYLDLSFSGREFAPEQAAGIARLKSGSYSVRGPLAVGAALAGASRPATGALETFGEKAGEAFQLADDLSGMFEDPVISGKDAQADLVQGRPTLLIALALELSPDSSRRVIRAAWGNPTATKEQRQAAKHVILESGAPAKVSERIQGLIAGAKAALANPPSKNLAPGPCVSLEELADGIAAQVRVVG